MSKGVRYEYSLNGQRTATLGAVGNRTSLTYDGFDRLERQEFPEVDRKSSASNPSDFESYVLDQNGNQTQVTRRGGAQVFNTYDALNRLTHQSKPTNQPVDARDIYFGYDLTGNRLHARYGSPSGTAGVTFAYDILGRQVTETSYGRTVTSGWDKANQRNRITWPDQTFAATAYYADNRPVGLSAIVEFNYHPVGRRMWTVRPNGVNTVYDYDTAGRLNALQLQGSQPLFQTIAYTPAGQIRSLTQTNDTYRWKEQPTVNGSEKTYDGLNRDMTLTALSNGYDARGNVTNDGARTYTYDVDNKMIQAGPLTLAYDPLGRLLSTTRSTDGVQTWFLYDGPRLIAEYPSQGATIPSQRYAHGPGVDEPVLAYQYDTTTGALLSQRYLVADRQGSIIAAAPVSGSPTIYRYGPYGEPDSWGPDRFRYTGQIALADAQVYHYKARAYDPMAGRFLQTDPIWQDDDPNLYAYVGEDPANKSDPTGTDGLWSELVAGYGYGTEEVLSGYDKGVRGKPGTAAFEIGRAAGSASVMFGMVCGGGCGAKGTAPSQSSAKAARGDMILYRRGDRDSLSTLKSQAAAAEKAEGIKIHGVSTSTNPAAKAGQVVRCASCRDIEAAGFKVTQTGKNPAHHTVELPKPVTSEIQKKFNDLFKPVGE